jgi:hypothetical protein
VKSDECDTVLFEKCLLSGLLASLLLLLLFGNELKPMRLLVMLFIFVIEYGLTTWCGLLLFISMGILLAVVIFLEEVNKGISLWILFVLARL